LFGTTRKLEKKLEQTSGFRVMRFDISTVAKSARTSEYEKRENTRKSSYTKMTLSQISTSHKYVDTLYVSRCHISRSFACFAVRQSSMLRSLILAAPALASAAATPPFCRSTPSDASWPTLSEWSSLNETIGGSLIRTVPVASSCWPDANGTFASPSPRSCQEVNDKWTNGTWHSQLPESIDYQLYANNSCLPDESGSWTQKQGCKIGALPQYIVNSTKEVDVAAAMKWAADRNIRIVVKGTGHDLNGR
jgi:hypothetical protein